MDFKNTNLYFLQEDCISEFGHDKGIVIYRQSCERYASMLTEANYRGNKSIRTHIDKTMFPAIAYHLILQSHGYTKEEALGLTLKEMQKSAFILKAKIETSGFGKFPFAYNMFKLSVKWVVNKMYPDEGWEIEWVRFDNNEMIMHIRRCIYAELTIQYGCPELCSVFCASDTVIFQGYEPKIKFLRSGTIADGADFCDFHFIRGNK
jgi:hypothetical protein